MALSSMTGFARADGVSGAYHWAWELKSVNAKGLELRLRVPPGWDAIEAPLRARVAEALGRGTIHANLQVQRAGIAPGVRGRRGRGIRGSACKSDRDAPARRRCARRNIARPA